MGRGKGIRGVYSLASRSTDGEATMRAFVRSVLLPDMTHRAMRDIPQARERTIIDAGHHINLGLIEPLVSLLQPRVRFVRLIRSRYDTVRSFADKSPCGGNHDAWTPCPLWHTVELSPPSEDAWHRLSIHQQNLWVVDEVEARWQRMLARHPDLPYMDLRWCTGPEFARGWEVATAFMGQGGLALQSCDHHHHGQANFSDSELAAADAGYQSVMQYSADTERLLRSVRVPWDCKGGALSRQAL